MQKNSETLKQADKVGVFFQVGVVGWAPVSKRHSTRKTACNLQIYTCGEYNAGNLRLTSTSPASPLLIISNLRRKAKKKKGEAPPPVSSFCGGSLCLRSASVVISLSSTR